MHRGEENVERCGRGEEGNCVRGGQASLPHCVTHFFVALRFYKIEDVKGSMQRCAVQSHHGNIILELSFTDN